MCRPCPQYGSPRAKPRRGQQPNILRMLVTICHDCRFAGATNHHTITALNHIKSWKIYDSNTLFSSPTCCSSSLIRHSGRRAAGDKPPFSTADSTPSTPVSAQASSEASTRGAIAAIIPDRSRPWHQQNGSASKRMWVARCAPHHKDYSR